MTDEHLHQLLLRAGEDGRTRAEMQAWPVVAEAFAQERARRPQRSARRPLLAAAAALTAAALLVAAVSSPGAAVADWLRDHIVGNPGVEHSAPALTHIPGGGRLLVAAPAGVWVVQADGSRRLLRGYAGATWSPHGLYIGAWRGHELFAVAPDGTVHWSLARSGRIKSADWSPDGFRIAYLSGASLRVVAGDGTGDGEVRTRVAPVAPVWRPNAPHMLALAPRARTVDVVATDVRALAWRRQLPHSVHALAWSADGRLLAAAGTSRVSVLDGDGGRLRRVTTVGRGFHITAVAFSNSGQRLAVTSRSATGRARLITVDVGADGSKPHQLFSGAGRFSSVDWSPNDRWVLITWPAANQWLFLRSTGVSAIRAVADIARQFDPSQPAARFPHIADWCCGPN